MKKKKNKIYLTDAEIATLEEASKILDAFAALQERAVNPIGCNWDDEDIWGACEIIDDIVLYANEED